MIYTIYTLTDMASELCFYVGITEKDLHTRCSTHTSCGNYGNSSPVYNFIKENNISFEIEAIENINTEDKKYAYELEKYWIDQFRQWGFTLYNSVFNLSYKERKRQLANEFRVKQEEKFIIRIPISCKNKIDENCGDQSISVFMARAGLNYAMMRDIIYDLSFARDIDLKDLKNRAIQMVNKNKI